MGGVMSVWMKALLQEQEMGNAIKKTVISLLKVIYDSVYTQAT